MPEIIGELMARHPRLYCDLSNMTNTGVRPFTAVAKPASRGRGRH